MFRKILGPKKKKVNEQFRVLQNQEFYDLCRTPIIVTRVK
jgi:hypothetical protein